MYWKCLVLISTGLGASASMLSMRHERVRAVSQLTEAMERSVEHEHMLWAVRAELAEHAAPQRVREMALAQGLTSPIPREICPPDPADSPEPAPVQRSRGTRLALETGRASGGANEH